MRMFCGNTVPVVAIHTGIAWRICANGAPPVVEVVARDQHDEVLIECRSLRHDLHDPAIVDEARGEAWEVYRNIYTRPYR